MFDTTLKGKELLIILPALQLRVTTPAAALLWEHLQGRKLIVDTTLKKGKELLLSFPRFSCR